MNDLEKAIRDKNIKELNEFFRAISRAIRANFSKINPNKTKLKK